MKHLCTLLSIFSAASALGQSTRIESYRVVPPFVIPSTSNPPSSFGTWMNSSGGVVVAAVANAPQNSLGPQYSVLLYRRTSSGWALEEVFQGQPQATLFGMTPPKIHGDCLFIPAGGSTLSGVRIGDIFTYERNSTGWIPLGPIHATTATRFFGYVGELREDIAFARAYHDAHLGIAQPVYVFERVAQQWTQAAVLQPSLVPGTNPNRTIASSALQGDTAIVYSFASHISGGYVVNSIHVFDRQPNGAWVETGVLLNPLPVSNDDFGLWGSRLEGDWLAVSDPVWDGDPSRPGSVYMYKRTGNGPGGFELRQTLFASNATNGDQLGRAFDMRPGRLLVGAPMAVSGPLNHRNGMAYLFELDPATDRWIETTRLTSSDIEGNTMTAYTFGQSVAVEDDYCFVSDRIARHPNGMDTGAFYVYEFPVGSSGCTGEPGPTGPPAELAATGSGTAGVGVVEFSGTGLAPNGLGMLIASRSAGSVLHPGGSVGRLCLGGTITRVGASVGPADGGGAWSYALPLDPWISAPILPIVGGEMWHFQTWFRQPGGTSNFTGSLAITFR
jgi:hypothetical protein